MQPNTVAAIANERETDRERDADVPQRLIATPQGADASQFDLRDCRHRLYPKYWIAVMTTSAKMQSMKLDPTALMPATGTSVTDLSTAKPR